MTVLLARHLPKSKHVSYRRKEHQFSGKCDCVSERYVPEGWHLVQLRPVYRILYLIYGIGISSEIDDTVSLCLSGTWNLSGIFTLADV